MKNFKRISVGALLTLLIAIMLNVTDVKAAGYTGLVYDGNGQYYYLNDGMGSNYTGLIYDSNYGWWLINNGTVNFGYTGLYYDGNYGWWLINNGGVAFGYTGLYYDSNYGWWLINNGSVAFEYTGLYYDSNYGWWLINNGSVAFDYTGLYYDSNYGWWLINSGSIAFGYTGLYYDNNCGWWLIDNGTVAFGYTGLYYDNNYGWWLINSGNIAFGYTGLYYDNNYGWWLINNGTIAFEYNGMYNDATYGSWYIRSGAIDFSVNTTSRAYKIQHPTSAYNCTFDGDKVVMYVNSEDGVADEVLRLMNEYYFSKFEIILSLGVNSDVICCDLVSLLDIVLKDNNNWYWNRTGYFLKQHAVTNGKDDNRIELEMVAFATREKLVTLFNYVESVASSISADTTESYIRQVNDLIGWLCEHEEVTIGGVRESGSAYACLINHKAVTEGYTRAFKLFMDLRGIECRYVTLGLDYNTSRDSMNVVKVDGAWYVIDTAWNDVQGGYAIYLIGCEASADPDSYKSGIKELTGITLSEKNYPCSR